MERLGKKVKRPLIYRIPVILFLVVILAFSLRGTWEMYGRYTEAKDAALDADRKIAELKEREAFLNKAIRDLKTEEGIERELRSQFNVKREGEEVVVVIEEEVLPVPPLKQSLTSSVLEWFRSIF